MTFHLTVDELAYLSREGELMGIEANYKAKL